MSDFWKAFMTAGDSWCDKCKRNVKDLFQAVSVYSDDNRVYCPVCGTALTDYRKVRLILLLVVGLPIFLCVGGLTGFFKNNGPQPAPGPQQPAAQQKAAPDLSRFTYMPFTPMPAQIRPGGTTTVRLQVSRKGDSKSALTFQVFSHSLNDLVVEDPIGPLQLPANQDSAQFSIGLRATQNAQLGERVIEIKENAPVSENESLKIKVKVAW